MPHWRAQPGPQTPQQQRQVGALCAIKSVQLIHHHVAQRGGRVVRPELAVFGAQHQIVQHLVVGQQDVGGMFAQRVPVGDDRAGCHHHALPRRGGLPAHVQAHPQTRKRRYLGHQLGHAAGLVRG